MSLVYINKVKDNPVAFEAKVREISKKLGINPNALMLVINIETAGTFDPSIQNTKYSIQGGYATGLIQFAPETAKSLGTTTDELKQMTNLEQLDYVYKYFQKYAGQINGFEDLYIITFFPAVLGKSDDTVIETKNISASSVAQSNPIFDLNKDNQITVGEFKQAIDARIPPDYVPDATPEPTKIDKIVAYSKQPTNWWKFVVIGGLLIGMYFLGKKAGFWGKSK